METMVARRREPWRKVQVHAMLQRVVVGMPAVTTARWQEPWRQAQMHALLQRAVVEMPARHGELQVASVRQWG